MSGQTLYTTDARLYDAAFSWDRSDEIDWLTERLGVDCAPVLEPACGSGRLLVGFARRGIEAVGLDISPDMVRLARKRLRAERLPGDAVVGDMVEFRLGRVFGAAVCPIDSLAYLHDRSELVRHLDCVARHLRPGGAYLVQLDLRDADDPWRAVRPSVWERDADGTCVRTTWRVEEIDVQSGIEVHRCTIECLSGPDEGRVFEEVHRMASWTPERWAEAIASSRFRYAAVYDGEKDERARRPVGTSGRLLWHELELEP